MYKKRKKKQFFEFLFFINFSELFFGFNKRFYVPIMEVENNLVVIARRRRRADRGPQRAAIRDEEYSAWDFCTRGPRAP